MSAKQSEFDSLIEAFENAVDKGLAERPAVKKAIDDPFVYIPCLEEALSAYGIAMSKFISVEIQDWNDGQVAAIREAQNLARHLLGDLLDLQNKAPLLLRKQDILVDREGEIFRQEVPEDGAVVGGEPPPCCFTKISFKNIHDATIKVGARHESGALVSAEIKKNKTKALSWTDDDRQPIPGALGHCVTLEVQEKQGGGWGPVLSLRLCCEHGDDGDVTPRRGQRLTVSGPAPAGEAGATVLPPRLTALEIKSVVIADPCPSGETGSAGSSTSGTPDSEIRNLPGTQVDRRDYVFGAHARIRFTPTENGCREFCFVQGKIRKTRLKFPGATDFREANMLSTGDAYELDVERGARIPCYPHVSELPGGGKEMRDYPTVKNPWGQVTVDGQASGGLPDGTEMEVIWTFRTWVVCLNPRPVSVLGYFDWSVTMNLIVRQPPARTTGQISSRKPVWRNDQDLDNYRRVAGEAAQSAGFLPP